MCRKPDNIGFDTFDFSITQSYRNIAGFDSYSLTANRNVAVNANTQFGLPTRIASCQNASMFIGRSHSAPVSPYGRSQNNAAALLAGSVFSTSKQSP